MTLDNFNIALRAFTRRNPFAPYIVQFMSGDEVVVRHPEAIRMTGEVFQFTGTDNRKRLFDCESVCQLLDLPPEESGPELPAEAEGS
jgi:hypothetical protein